MTYAGRVLSMRAQTSTELRSKLNRRAANKSDPDAVIAKLQEVGFLNDEKFAELFASWRRDSQRLGKGRVVRELLTRRVAPAVAKQAAEKAYEAVDENALAADFLVRKYRGKDLREMLARANQDREKHMASAYRKLRTSGFSSSATIHALKRYTTDATHLEEMNEVEEMGG